MIYYSQKYPAFTQLKTILPRAYVAGSKIKCHVLLFNYRPFNLIISVHFAVETPKSVVYYKVYSQNAPIKRK